MIEVQMRVDDDVDFVGRNSGGLEVLQQQRLVAIDGLALLAELAADPGLDQHIVPASADQQGIQAHGNVVALVGGDAFFPQNFRHHAEHGAAIQVVVAIGKYRQFEVAQRRTVHGLSPDKGMVSIILNFASAKGDRISRIREHPCTQLDFNSLEYCLWCFSAYCCWRNDSDGERGRQAWNRRRTPQSVQQPSRLRTSDDFAQMRDDLNKMESLNMNMSSEIEFLHDQNLQILLRTNSQMWTILIRDLRRQLAAGGAAPKAQRPSCMRN